MSHSVITAKKLLLSIVGSGILAFGLYHIHAQSDITEGGALGLILLAEYWLGISPAWSSLLINGLCYLIGIRTLGREFLVYSAICSGCFTVFYRVFECFPPFCPALTAMPMLSAVLGALFVGIGVGLCVRAGGAPSGDDALAMSLSHLFGFPIERVYLVSDLTVLGLSLSYLPMERIVCSLITVVLSGRIIGIVQRYKKAAA